MAKSMGYSQSTVETKTRQRSAGFVRSFIDHPASVGESYLGHLFFAVRFATRLLAAGCAALVHAFIPAWFETTASDQICKMHADLVSRHSGPQRD